MRKGPVEIEETLASEVELTLDLITVPLLPIHEEQIGQLVRKLDSVLRLAETSNESPRGTTESEDFAAADLPARAHLRAQ
jgi:hypothetical protein